VKRKPERYEEEPLERDSSKVVINNNKLF